jgi:hypothetical protein
MTFEDPYWVESARALARLFTYMPDVDPSDLGDDPQKFLASYVPKGLWDERAESWRSTFANMGDKEFQGVYQTYLEERDKPGFKYWEESK